MAQIHVVPWWLLVLAMSKRRIAVAPRQTVWTLDYPTSKVSVMVKRKEKKRSDKWKNFAGKSTCAAVAHLGDKSQPVSVKIVWSITLIVGLFLTTVSSYFSAKSFINFSGNSEMMLQTNSDNWIEHPNYHICTSNTFNLTILKEMGFVDVEMVSYLILTTSLFVVSPALAQNLEKQRQLASKFDEILAQNGMKDVAQVFQRALLKCEDIIAGCISTSSYVDGVDCCAKFFPSGSFASSTGACVTTYSAPPIIQYIPSLGFGFVVLVRDLRDASALDNSIINPIMANQKGVAFSVSDKWTDPTVALFLDKHYTRIGLWTSVAISRTTINDEDIMTSVISRKVCAHRNDHERFRELVPGFDNYTEENCNYAVRQKRMIEQSNCYMMTLPYKGDLPPCRPNQLLEFEQLIKSINYNLSIRELNCVGECWKETYKVSASYADFQLTANFRFGNWSISPNQSKNLAAINFYYPSFMQTLLVNHYPTINQWFGILGGNLGLFLGASMVTLVELLVVCFSCCCSSSRKKMMANTKF